MSISNDNEEMYTLKIIGKVVNATCTRHKMYLTLELFDYLMLKVVKKSNNDNCGFEKKEYVTLFHTNTENAIRALAKTLYPEKQYQTKKQFDGILHVTSDKKCQNVYRFYDDNNTENQPHIVNGSKITEKYVVVQAIPKLNWQNIKRHSFYTNECIYYFDDEQELGLYLTEHCDLSETCVKDAPLWFQSLYNYGIKHLNVNEHYKSQKTT